MLRFSRAFATTTLVATLLLVAGSPALAQDTDNDGLPNASDPCSTDPRNLCAGPVAIDSVTLLPIRINATRAEAKECFGSKVDCNGQVWTTDFGYNFSKSSNDCNVGGTGEACVISGITEIFGCENEETEDIFQCDHYDDLTNGELAYTFNVPNGRYIVNLLFANTRTTTNAAGSRVFDIFVEGNLAYDNFDQVVAAGATAKAVVRAVDVTVTDGNGLSILFGHVTNDPAIKAIEVLAFGCTSSAQCNDGKVCTTDTCVAGACQYANNTAACNDGVACTSNDICGGGTCAGTSNCPAGQSCSAQTGVCSAAAVSFNLSQLVGETLTKPTSLDFGPDGKLYVAQQNGAIFAYTIQKNGPNNYVITNTQIINLVQNIPNHNDDGSAAPTIPNRLVTGGLLATGTAANPILYVASADPRIGGGLKANNTNLDTNSGVVSRLTWNGSAWNKLDLVRGLPRSEENHSGNGLALNTATNTLYVAYGGHTNMGAPSNNFVFLPEYALSAAILSIDLNAIGNTTYDLPTLDDETRAGATDANDPFGGNDGKNQAKLVPGGPVQVYSPGFRNPYDLVITEAGHMYTIDNASNATWGNVPINEGPAGNCTNALSEPGLSHLDNLHFVTPGFYGGHPNPTRANMANTFNTSNPQSPVTVNHAVECDYRQPGVTDSALATWNSSTNGLTEYTTNDFGGQMKGNLLTVSLNSKLYRIQLNAAGTAVTSVDPLFSNVGGAPLDVIALGANDPYPGTIWVADHGLSELYVFEPNISVGCTGADNPALDEDGDQFDNADEIDNGTDPCSSADVPADADGDFTSDLNDNDDDNDGLSDTVDKFALDAGNGATTAIPLLYGWENDEPPHPGILELGFTGLMTNGTSNYQALFDTTKMTAGGAAGVTTVDQVAEGDALGATNTQNYGFQFGVDANGTGASVFTVHTRLVGPFLGTTPTDFQSMGLFIGTGDQDNYFKLVASSNGGSGGVQSLMETGGIAQTGPNDLVILPGPDNLDLFLIVNKSASTVQPAYTITNVGVTSTLFYLGNPVAIPASWLSDPTSGLAVGVISTSRGAAPVFGATWDFIEVLVGAPNCTTNAQCDDANPCTADLCNSSVCANNPVVDGTSCNDGVTCTTADSCSAGVCGGADSCPLFQACDAGSGTCGAVSGDPDNDGLAGTGDPCPRDPRNFCYGPVATDVTTSKAIRLHSHTSSNAECGGTKVDCSGKTWLAGFGHNTGSNNICDLNGGGENCVISGLTALFGCEDEATSDIFQCYLSDQTTAPELQYSYNVPDGNYVVNLFFANAYTGTTTGGSRVFDINIENALAFNHFDPIAAANGSGIAVVRSTVATVSDGNGLQIDFVHGVQNPALAAIEVLAAGAAPPLCTTDAQCSDNNVCNGIEACNLVTGCVAGTPLTCSDGNACNGAETCDPTTGCQSGTPLTCNDGNVCNGTETCDTVTGCLPGAPLACNDNNACNGTETCDTVTGCLPGAPLTCNDSNACNGTETCNTVTGCVAGTPLNCSDGDPCTTDSCSAGACVHSGSCPPTGQVSIDAASIRTSCVGTGGDTITLTGVAVGSQPDRILVVTAGGKENDGDCDLSLASATATYGGTLMSKAVARVSNTGTSTQRVCNAVFYMLNPPTGTANVVVSFPKATASTINNRHAGALVIYDAAQQAPEVVASAGANSFLATINTTITPLTGGSVVVDVMTRGAAGLVTGSYTTTQTGQVEQWDLTCGALTSATSTEVVASAGLTVLGWLSTNPARYAHALAAFAPSGVTATTTTTTLSPTTTTTLPAGDGEAFVTITPTGGINASTFNSNSLDSFSYNVRNDSLSGQLITRVRFEFAATLLPDLVFDPAGKAGDKASGCLDKWNPNAAIATGFVTPADPCTTPYSVPYELGYKAIDIFFTDFGFGETFGFAADADPTSIRGTTGQGGDSTGSVSGLELTGATVTIWFDDGSQISGEVFRIGGSSGGSQNIIKASPPAAPTIAALGVATPATVTSAAQTIRVSGPVGATVRLLRVQAELGLNGGTGYDLDPFEANSAVAVAQTNGTIGAGGFIDIPVTLTRTSDSSDLNYFAAVIEAGDGSGQTGLVSNVVVLEYVPQSQPPSLVCVVAATDPTRILNGAMTTSATYAGGTDADPLLNSLASALLFANSGTSTTTAGGPDNATYVVTLPETATWYLWGRFYYPGTPGSNDANSFFASVDGGSALKLGNKKDRFRQWHWDGNGNVEQGAVGGLALGTLGAGGHSIKIEKREVTPIAPRIDVFCLTKDAVNPPSDAAVAPLLGLP